MLKKSSKGSSKVTGKSGNDTEDNYGGVCLLTIMMVVVIEVVLMVVMVIAMT